MHMWTKFDIKFDAECLDKKKFEYAQEQILFSVNKDNFMFFFYERNSMNILQNLLLCSTEDRKSKKQSRYSFNDRFCSVC